MSPAERSESIAATCPGPAASILHRSVLESTHLIAFDTTQHIIFWTGEDARIYGLEARDVIGRSDREVLRSQFPETWERLLEKLERDQEWSGTVVHHRANGDPLRLLANWRPLRDESGKLTGVVEHVRGESLERLANNPLQAARTLEALIDASPVAIIALNAEGRIDIWNTQAEAFFQMSEESTLGHRFEDLPLRWHYPESISRLMQDDAPAHIATRVTTPNQITLDLGIWSSPLVGDNGVEGHVLVVLDETEKKFLEQALLEAGEREQRRIGQQLHDHLCQQLLGAAFGAQALSRELHHSQSPSEERASELARLINDSVVEARNMARGINPIELDPAGLMSALQELIARVPHGVTAEFDCPNSVLVDNSELALHAFRIAQEALTNALRIAGATWIRISLSCRDHVCTIQIADNGRVAPDDQESNASVGIGIMRYRAQAIGGHLHVDHVDGRGTTVTCTFPNPQ